MVGAEGGSGAISFDDDRRGGGRFSALLVNLDQGVESVWFTDTPGPERFLIFLFGHYSRLLRYLVVTQLGPADFRNERNASADAATSCATSWLPLIRRIRRVVARRWTGRTTQRFTGENAAVERNRVRRCGPRTLRN